MIAQRGITRRRHGQLERIDGTAASIVEARDRLARELRARPTVDVPRELRVASLISSNADHRVAQARVLGESGLAVGLERGPGLAHAAAPRP